MVRVCINFLNRQHLAWQLACQDPTAGLCLRPYGGPRRRTVSYELGTPVVLNRQLMAAGTERAGLPCARGKPSTLHPTPYTLHPTPYTLHPTPYTLHPAP